MLDTAPPITLAEPLSQRLARRFIQFIGWRVEGELPYALDKFILVIAPHTSNWDFVVGLPCGFAIGLMAQWPYGVMAKASAFRGPMGPLMRRLGCLPIDRRAAHNVVEQMARIFEQRERLMLVITPEGTRQYRPHWKSGFYHIALQANVPVVLGTLDYARRVGRIGEPFFLTGNVDADLTHIRAFFADAQPKYPQNAGDIRFKE